MENAIFKDNNELLKNMIQFANDEEAIKLPPQAMTSDAIFKDRFDKNYRSAISFIIGNFVAFNPSNKSIKCSYYAWDSDYQKLVEEAINHLPPVHMNIVINGDPSNPQTMDGIVVDYYITNKKEYIYIIKMVGGFDMITISKED